MTSTQPTQPTAAPRLDQIQSWLAHFVAPGDIAELIAFDATWEDKPARTVCGFFDHAHLRDMARNALRLSGTASGVYVTLNPLKPDVLARRRNCLGARSKGVAATDADVLMRRWVFLDIDPVRQKDQSATDAEKLLAWDRACEVRAWLANIERWFAQPDIVADSGNGFHLLYRLSEPPSTDANEPDPTAQLLHGLSDTFTDARVAIDIKVSNLGRIIKCPGTLARKGRATKARPHRWSWVIEPATTTTAES